MNQLSETLSKFLKKKQQLNPRYSIRMLSKHVNVSHTGLSYIFNGKRTPTIRVLTDLCTLLDIDLETQDFLIKSVLELKNQVFEDHHFSLAKADISSVKNKKVCRWEQASNEQFSALESWEYFAIMQATLLEDFDGSTEFIARKLSIPISFVEKSITKLLQGGLVTYSSDNKKIAKSSPFVEYQSRNKEKLQMYHKSSLLKTIEIMEENIEESDLIRRIITGGAVTCSSKNIPLIKQKIAETIKEVINLCAEGEQDQVYQISMQFIPLS